MSGDEMKLTVSGKGESPFNCGFFNGYSRLRWVSRETGEDGLPLRVRTPEPVVKCFSPPFPFEAAGKEYTDLAQLTAQETGEWYALDVYGRRVLALSEGFPCFDSWDYEHENRRYRWWIILLPESITLVYHEDESGKITVNEDVLDLSNKCVKALGALGVIE